MAIFTRNVLIISLITYFECKCSFSAFVKKCSEKRELEGQVPGRKFMHRLAKRFQKTGTVDKGKPSGRPRTIRNTSNIYSVAQSIIEKSNRSAAKCSKKLDISRTSVRRILRRDLEWSPFKPRVVHMMNEYDHNRRFWFADGMLKLLNNSEGMELLNNFLFLDEVFIKLNSHQCTSNAVYWDETNPNMIVERKLNGYGLMFLLCCTVRGVLVYCFDSIEIPEKFEKFSKKGKRKPKNVYRGMPCNSDTFLYILKEKMVKRDLSMLFPDISLSDIIICMDGSPTHTAGHVTEFMNNTFNLWIGNNSPGLQWPRLHVTFI